ncbi:MAG: hypothetical protein CVT48_01970 [Thermoplasmata archaeon HGW-Thermoplasmata-1]|nr:MAG: hypothetical protein CVT48_01970 [Thermoplasmata archaeon HGW-Thermoplasmata-1]
MHVERCAIAILLTLSLIFPAVAASREYGISCEGVTSMKMDYIDKIPRPVPFNISINIANGSAIDFFVLAVDAAYNQDMADSILFNDENVTLWVLFSRTNITYENFSYDPENYPDMMENESIDKICAVFVSRNDTSSEGAESSVVTISMSYGRFGIAAVAFGVLLSLPAVAVFAFPAVASIIKRLKK